MRAGGSLIDAVEAGGMVPEADPNNHCVGYSGYPERDGPITHDAVIMDDAGGIGAVAALESTTHAISVARRVMERTPHTMLVGEGTTTLARDEGFPQVKLLTPKRQGRGANGPGPRSTNLRPIARPHNPHTRRFAGSRYDPFACAHARRPHSGLVHDVWHGVQDARPRRRSFQVGSGLYVEAGVGGATSTGLDEEVTRVAGTARVVASMRAGAIP
jgi:N4-(beta-N-acetylglucosaminyl)-L-asparaginase